MNTLRTSLPLVVSLLVACSGSSSNTDDVLVTPKDAVVDLAPSDGGSDLGGAETVVTPDITAPVDMAPMVCRDTDMDGISDNVEGAPRVDTDRDMMPDYMDTDSDNDGYSDAVEFNRTYPMYDARRAMLTCGQQGDNCDGTLGVASDVLPNFRDTDSDNDGLTDREEREFNTDPCLGDTDMDGASDLVERAAMSNPRDRTAVPPSNSLFVVLPYYPPGMMGMHEVREFNFATRIRQADVFFLIDNSTSMRPVIDNLRTNLSSVIVPGIQRAIPDIQMGVGSFDSMPISPQGQPGTSTVAGDYTLWIRQRVTGEIAMVQRAFDTMRTIDEDSMMLFVGGNEPECQTEAAFQVVDGAGVRGHETDAAALRSVLNARDPMGNGWVPRVDSMRDCGGSGRYGWGCFNDGRVPLVVLASDARWYDGCDPASPRTPDGLGHDCSELVAAYNRRGALFIGIDVGDGVEGRTWRNANLVARMTRTLDGMGRPIVFGPGSAGIAGVAANVVEAITQIAGQTRQDITTRVVADRTAMGLPTGRTTADFVKAVTPSRGEPAMPTGYERQDTTTFYNVSPSTRVVFRADFYNDFQPGAMTARLFTATIEVLGRGNNVVDTRPVFIVVPAEGGGQPPG